VERGLPVRLSGRSGCAGGTPGRCDRHATQSKALARDCARQSDEEDIKEILSLDDFALARAYLEQGRVEQAGQALASAVFWSFAQMVNPARRTRIRASGMPICARTAQR